jgi:autotransporter-associated beta strand protein
MKSSGCISLAGARLHAAIVALPQASVFGLAVAAVAFGSSTLSAQTTVLQGPNLFSTDTTLSLGALTRNAGGVALFSGTGTISASATLGNGLVGPWAIVQRAGAATNNGTGGFTFATISGGNITPYTAATSLTGTGAWGGIPSGGTGTINYDLSTSSALLGSTGLLRTVNSLRYTGGGARQPGNNAGDLFSTNSIMNSGTGTLTLGRNGANVTNDFSFGILTGANRDLVLAPMSANIVLYSFIKNNSGGASDVTVFGNNTAELAGVNLYTGATTVAGGTLLVSGAGSINTTSGVTVNGTGAKYVHTSSVASSRTITLTKGTVDGTGTLGTVNVGDDTGGVLANGNGGTGTLTVGTLSFAGGATISGNYVIGSKPFNVTGALSTVAANGQVTVNLTAPGGWTTGLNNIIGFGTFGGSASDFTAGSITGTNSRQSVGGFSLNGNNLALQINGDNPKWTGGQSGAWTTDVIGGSSNWTLVTAGTATDFIAADNVLFDDTATGTAVDITTANVAPVTTEFNNSAKNYTLSSSGGFGIANGSLVKNGTGGLTIANANTYAGGTTLNGGTLNVNNAGALGSGPLVINGGVLDNTSGVAITTTGNPVQTWAADVQFTGSNDLNLGNGNVALTGGDRTVTVDAGTLSVGRLAAVGALTKAGNGTLTLNPTAVSTVAGALNVNAGTLNIGAQDLTATGLSGSGTIGNGSATTRWLFVTNATDNTFAGVLQDGAGAGKLGFNKNGVGAMTLSGVNTLTDTVTINDGALRFSGAGSLANAGTYVIANNGVLQVSANGQLGSAPIQINSAGGGVGTANRLEISGDTTVTGPITLAQRNESSPGGVIASDAIRNTGGDNTLSGPITIVAGGNQARINSEAGSLTLSGSITTTSTTARSLFFQGAGNGTVSGVISDNAGNAAGKINVTKEGAGVWNLTGANTYTGTTTISAGTLAVNGSIGNSVVTVGSAGTLIGSGTIGGATTVNGTLAPGNSPGLLTFASDLTLGATATTEFEINGTDRGVSYDGVNVGGAMTYNGTQSVFFNAPITAGVFDLVGGGFTSQSGAFSSVSIGGSFAETLAGPVTLTGSGWSASGTLWNYAFNYTDGDLTISAIPEPSAVAALAGLAGLAFAGLRRRRPAGKR